MLLEQSRSTLDAAWSSGLARQAQPRVTHGHETKGRHSRTGSDPSSTQARMGSAETDRRPTSLRSRLRCFRITRESSVEAGLVLRTRSVLSSGQQADKNEPPPNDS